MRISERYRAIHADVVALANRLEQKNETPQSAALKALQGAARELAGEIETVGEIPQIRLEERLSPVLLKAHGGLDRARVALETAGLQDDAARIWELEQQVYRLLNDL